MGIPPKLVFLAVEFLGSSTRLFSEKRKSPFLGRTHLLSTGGRGTCMTDLLIGEKLFVRVPVSTTDAEDEDRLHLVDSEGVLA